MPVMVMHIVFCHVLSRLELHAVAHVSPVQAPLLSKGMSMEERCQCSVEGFLLHDLFFLLSKEKEDAQLPIGWFLGGNGEWTFLTPFDNLEMRPAVLLTFHSQRGQAIFGGRYMLPGQTDDEHAPEHSACSGGSHIDKA